MTETNETTLKPFTVQRVIDLCDEIHRRERDGLVSDCKALGLSSIDHQVLAVVEARRERQSIGALLRYASSVAGAVAIITEACEAAGADAEAVIGSMPLERRSSTAMAIVGHPTSAIGATAGR